MYNHNKAQQSKNRMHISWDILYPHQRGTRFLCFLFYDDSGNQFYSYGSTLIPAWKSNHVHYNVWDEITCPFPILDSLFSISAIVQLKFNISIYENYMKLYIYIYINSIGIIHLGVVSCHPHTTSSTSMSTQSPYYWRTTLSETSLSPFLYA